MKDGTWNPQEADCGVPPGHVNVTTLPYVPANWSVLHSEPIDFSGLGQFNRHSSRPQSPLDKWGGVARVQVGCNARCWQHLDIASSISAPLRHGDMGVAIVTLSELIFSHIKREFTLTEVASHVGDAFQQWRDREQGFDIRVYIIGASYAVPGKPSESRIANASRVMAITKQISNFTGSLSGIKASISTVFYRHEANDEYVSTTVHVLSRRCYKDLRVYNVDRQTDLWIQGVDTNIFYETLHGDSSAIYPPVKAAIQPEKYELEVMRAMFPGWEPPSESSEESPQQ
ncbi:hypothetical protein BGW36DRAFT_421619 [Talaromyces proteolyticus]|uniref:Uncharacterized protein n=1 Tax=Talaromyces proteolyticus TaxID=1131652 RepID=A0AAD4Q5W2_9EURO|nr:uncharacterized protein BGW36DRAFT_421619 [Talaromyces proteolyticus]KAH8705041.1 hypothetical protein BGW36DRAFT_421619 [Talaromyces proteolyticus]